MKDLFDVPCEFDELEAKSPEFAGWLKTLYKNGNRLFLHKLDPVRFRVTFYTEEHCYEIIAVRKVDGYPGYLGCTKKLKCMAVTLVGEEVLSNGPCVFDTWIEILADIVSNEIKEE